MNRIKTVKELFRPLLPTLNKKRIKKNVLYFIDFTKFHIFEQLLLEESLYRLSSSLSEGLNNVGFIVLNNTNNGIEEKKKYYNKCVVLGISGKVSDYIKDVNYIKEHEICLIKRFTGGGTVYINKNCLLVSLILPHSFYNLSSIYPSNITEWSFNSFYGKFMNEKKKNILFNENFSYFENDYVCKIYDEKSKKVKLKKVGGNAQAFSKNYFVHHTSFIWFCNYNEMENVLLNPLKQPAYRSKRSHYDFIESLRSCLHKNINYPNDFIERFIYHIRQIVNEKNSNQDEFWFFNKININVNENSYGSDYVDNIHYVDVSLLKELFLSYNNNIYTNNLRSTYFVDVEGNKVPDTYYKIPSFILD